MLIQALNDYYSVLENSGKLVQEGYSESDISYLIELNPDGDLVSIIDKRVKQTIKKKNKDVVNMVPYKMNLPERSRSTKVSANFVENRPGYIFGLEYKPGNEDETLSTESKGDTEKKRAKLKLQHDSFKKEVQKDFSGMKSDIARAYVNFAVKWNPEEQTHNEELIKLNADLNKAKFAFCMAGHPEVLLHEDPEVRERWESLKNSDNLSNSTLCQCAVTGEMLPVAKVHDAIQSGRGIGIKNAGINPSLVNFKPESFLSYGHEQGENACISQNVMKRYTKALNWLLSSPSNHCYIDGLTVFFWSSDGNQANESLVKRMFVGRDKKGSSDEIDSAILNIMQDAGRGLTTEKQIGQFNDKFNSKSDFYIVGLAPNSSRIQIKFIYRQKFGRLLNNIIRHQNDMKMHADMKPISLYAIKNELTSPKITNRDKRVFTPFNSILNAIIVNAGVLLTQMDDEN
jgi:CRISPR-associated protein Csd1